MFSNNRRQSYTFDEIRLFIESQNIQKINNIISAMNEVHFAELLRKTGDNEYNLFHYMGTNGNIEIFKIFYNKNHQLSMENLKEKDEFGYTPIDVARHNRFNEFVEIANNFISTQEYTYG